MTPAVSQTINDQSIGDSPVDSLSDDRADYLAPEYAKGRLYDSGFDQKAWLTVAVLLSLVVFKLVDPLVLRIFGMVVCLVVGLLGFVTTNEGQGYLIPGDHRRSRAIRNRHKGFVSPDGQNTPIRDRDYGIGLVGVYVGGERETDCGCLPTGFIVPTHAGRIAFALALGGSRFAGANWSQRKQFEQRVIDVLGQAAALVGFEATGISFALINGTRPANPHPLVHGLRNYALHPDFIDPIAGSVADLQARALDERIRTMYYNGAEPVNYLVVTLDTPASWRDAMAGHGDLESTAVEDSTVQLLINHFVNGLKQVGLRDVVCLNILELDEYVQTQRCISDVGAKHGELFARRLRFRTMTVDEIVDELSRSNPWPEHLIRLESTYLFMDGTYFRMYRTLNYGLWRRFRPGAMLAVQNPNGSRWNITTVIGRVVNAAVEEKRMTRSIVFQRALSDEKNSAQRYLSEREREERKATEREQTDMYRLRAPVIKYDRLPVVCAPSKRLLGLYTVATVGAHTLRMLSIAPIKLEVRQLRAFYRAVLGIDI